MSKAAINTGQLACWIALCAVTTVGCKSLSLPRIDPSGRRIFLPSDQNVAPAVPSSPTATCGIFPRPAYTTPQLPPPCPPGFPGDSTAGCPQPGGAHPGAANNAPGLASATVGPGLRLTPTRLIAPVGSEVVLKAGVRALDGSTTSNQKIEWVMSQESVGHFVAVDDEQRKRCRHRWARRAHKVTGDYAIGRTASSASVISRGTPVRDDDILVGQGESWVSVSSAGEGTSRVSAIALQTEEWDLRQQTATIHWIDAQWTFPGPSVGRAGEPRSLVTTVSRQTDGAPLPGWTVRYQILGGAAAGVGDADRQSFDATTDNNGQATVRVVPQNDQSGVTQLAIHVIQPADVTRGGAPMVLAQETSTVTWSAPALAVKMSGPEHANVDDSVTYHAEISNPGDLTAENVVARCLLPDRVKFISSNPPARILGNRLEWSLDNLSGRTVRPIQITCQIERRGQLRCCVSAEADSNLTADACATTNVVVPSLEIELEGPEKAEVGEQVQFRFRVRNTGVEPITNVVLVDNFDSGFRHASATSPIRRTIGDLAAGEQSGPLAITFTIASAGQLCHTLETIADAGQYAAERYCLTATQPQPQVNPAATVRIVGPQRQRVNDLASFDVTITNTGDTELANVRILARYTDNLQPTDATPDFVEPVRAGELEWVVDKLPSRMAVSRQIRCRCIAPDPGACLRVTVEADPPMVVADEACLEILPGLVRPAPGGAGPATDAGDTPAGNGAAEVTGTLRVTMTDLGDPVSVTQSTTYLIRIHNDRNVSDRNVVLTVVAPAGMKIERVAGPTEYQTVSADSRVMQMRPVAEMRPGEEIEFRAEVTALQAGRATFAAEVESNRLDQKLTIEEDTTVFAAPGN